MSSNISLSLSLAIEGGTCASLPFFLCSYYLGKILDQAGITSTRTQTQIQVIINCWSFAIAIFGSFMLDILGRRIQTFIGVGGMVVTLCLIGGLIRRTLPPWLLSSALRLLMLIIFCRLWRDYGRVWDIRDHCRHLPLPGLLRLLHHAHDESVPDRGCAVQAQGHCHFHLSHAGRGVRVCFPPFSDRLTSFFWGVVSLTDKILPRLLASFTMAFAMADLGWKFYFINAAWDLVFLIIAYFTFVETRGLKLEEIDAKFEGASFLDGVGDEKSDDGKLGDTGEKNVSQSAVEVPIGIK